MRRAQRSCQLLNTRQHPPCNLNQFTDTLPTIPEFKWSTNNRETQLWFQSGLTWDTTVLDKGSALCVIIVLTNLRTEQWNKPHIYELHYKKNISKWAFFWSFFVIHVSLFSHSFDLLNRIMRLGSFFQTPFNHEKLKKWLLLTFLII